MNAKIIYINNNNYNMYNKITMAILTTFSLSSVQAQYQVIYPLKDKIQFFQYNKYESLKSNWLNDGNIYDCSNWSPLTSTITINQPFVQTATDCKQNQSRSIQDRELDKVSGNVRNVGSPYNENQVIQANSTRDALGTKESWESITPTYTIWTNAGDIVDCSNWSPTPNTITVGTSYTQTATDCKQPQTRSRQDREQESTTHEIRNIGTSINESQFIAASSTRPSIGTKETWSATTPTYTEWTNNGVVTDCSNWSPAPSTVTVGQSFIQTATDCKQPQTRSRQEREQEITTLAFRNKDVAVTETQNVVAASTRQSVGTKETWIATTPTYTTWTNNGAFTSCTNWTPSPSTVTVGQSFTQTATDCQQQQTRSRQDREQETTTGSIRNKGTAVTENQTIAASTTRTATGTKETWAATTPTYTAWTNSGSVTGCSNWSPATSTVTVGQSFTQTATDCQQAQTRSRQDREQESTTGAFRNVGSVVTESQSITASSTRTATGTKETWVATTPTYTTWINSGSVTGCSNWTPDTSTVAYGTSFTQTATNCQQTQTRSRQDREQETTTGSVRNAGSAVTESQNITASSTRTATGTKENWVATTPTYTAWANNGAPTGCGTWTPSTNSVARGNAFTQYANCTQNQTRTRQDRQQDSGTGAIRNSGAPVTESQNVSVSSSRAATGTYYCDRICQGGK